MTKKAEKKRVEPIKFDVTREMQDYILTGQALLRNVNKKTGEVYKCAHSVWSNLKSGFIEEYGLEVGHYVYLLQYMEKKQIIFNQPTKGGVNIYLWADRPKVDRKSQEKSKGQKVNERIKAAMKK